MDQEKKLKRKTILCDFRVSISVLMILLVCSIFSSNVTAQVVSENSIGQQITVKGKVFDESKSPIIGASVFLVGTKIGTITDINGSFSIKAPSKGKLSISYIGYSPQIILVSSDLSNIVLQENISKLDEVVVVGYGQVKRVNLTGAVSSLNMKEVADFPASNLASVLSGTMPGVHVNEPTGNPMGVSTISVRINGSFSASGDPLYVIDGFIRDVYAFNLLDPSEIETISVLKDASASVYGVRGYNGVILVSTKKANQENQK
jgi:TonB-dependent SusC/RagA subfamily outer membrane receptor